MAEGARLLLIDDDEHIQEVVRVAVEADGYELDCCSHGKVGLEEVIARQPDLVMLDIMMPGLSGWEVCQALRERGLGVPVIMLTAKDEEDDEIRGLGLGADDYITKPFSPRQLVARIGALLRRSSARAPLYAIDPEKREVQIFGQPLDLTPKEFELFALLARRAGTVQKREDLLHFIWGADYAGTTRTVDEHVKRLRQKVAEKAGDREFIHTVWGLGYRFEVES